MYSYITDYRQKKNRKIGENSENALKRKKEKERKFNKKEKKKRKKKEKRKKAKRFNFVLLYLGPLRNNKQWYHCKRMCKVDFKVDFLNCFMPYADLLHLAPRFYATKSFSKVGCRVQTVWCRAQNSL